MLRLELRRDEVRGNVTFGRLFANGEYICYTLEDQVRFGVKVPGETAIPAGTYEVIVSYSRKFGRYMPELLNVPGFKGIRIHTGNTAKDTKGCVLVGFSRDVERIGQSRPAYQKVYRLIADGSHNGRAYITVTDPPTEAGGLPS